MSYIDSTDNGDDISGMSSNVHLKTNAMRGHVPAPYFSFNQTEITTRPLCMICSMDEMAKAQAMQLPRRKSQNRKLARRSKYLVKCMHENCNVVAHAALPKDSQVSKLQYFGGLTCFESAHHPKCKDLFTKINRNGKFYCRTIPSHPVVQDTKELYQSELPRRSSCERTIRSRPGRPPTVIRTNMHSNEFDSITAATGIDTGDLLSGVTTPEEPRRSIRITKPTRGTQLQRKRKRNDEQPNPLLRRSQRNNKSTQNQRPRRKASKQQIAMI